MKEFGGTPLHFAANKNHPQIIEYLIKQGASVDPLNYLNRTPLYEASFNGGTSSVKVLLDSGADFKIAAKDGSTPWHAANCNHYASFLKN